MEFSGDGFKNLPAFLNALNIVLQVLSSVAAQKISDLFCSAPDFLYLCSRNETGPDDGKDINGSLCRVPDGFAKLAEPL